MNVATDLRLGYLVPEFPSQTHIFFWREICALRGMGIDVVLISTRKPTPITCRHDFAIEAAVKTQYLFPPKASVLASWTLQMCSGLPAALSYLNELSWTGISRRIDHYGLLAAAVVL